MGLLEIRNLTVAFPTAYGVFKAVEGLDLTLEAGETFGVVGESGSGKSVSMLAVMGLLPRNAIVSADRIDFDGQDLVRLAPRAKRRILGKDIAMIFQEPMSSLNPCFSVGRQLTETLRAHTAASSASSRDRAIELLERVGIPDPARRFSSFPHQMSGGMCQRVMIAMAIACHPRLLIADEPTTALDVTIQAEILKLLAQLQRDSRMSLALITHDMGVVAENADRVLVMYAGQGVELSTADALFEKPRHPYTAALLEALPERSRGQRRLAVIPGTVPGAMDRLGGCVFAPRCRYAQEDCREHRPSMRRVGESDLRCHHPLGGPA